MINHPDILAELVRQRQQDLYHEAASRSRMSRALRKRSRSAR